MQPTIEQQHVIDLVNAEDGVSVAVEAGAGTGKTSTLVEIATSTDRIGYYVAFNRAIVQDAGRRMPDTVISSTAHSLAMKSVGHHYRHRLNQGRVRGWEIARRIGMQPLTVDIGVKGKRLSDDYLAGLAMRALRNFCFSAEEKPLPRHVPYIEGIDMPNAAMGRTYHNNDKVREHLAPFLERAWADVINPEGTLPFTHDHYLKIWQLSEPRIPGEFILFDEAQDAAPVMLAAIGAQDAQLVFVGDSQQQIYEWRGAVNALSTVDTSQRAFLTQSFRFGQAVADVANICLGKLRAELRLVGLASIESEVVSASMIREPDAILCRTNAGAMNKVMAAQRGGKRVHLVGGGGEIGSFVRAAKMLQDGQKVWYADLACFDSWGEVEEYVQNDPQGDELALMVKLIDEYGVEAILEALDHMPQERYAELVVSTAHKAKGREWDRVQLSGDFMVEDLPPEEWRLIYVAATRARRVLDLSQCHALRSAYEHKPLPMTLSGTGDA
jgi:cation transport regulator ChaB